MDQFETVLFTDGLSRLDATLNKIRDAEAILKNLVDFADMESVQAGNEARCLLVEHYLRYEWAYSDVSQWLNKVVKKLPGSDARQQALIAQAAYVCEQEDLTSCKHHLKSAVLDSRTNREQLPFLLHNLAVLNYGELMLWHERANSAA